MKPELTNQELLDRYIFSLRMGLHPEKAEDIAAEIRSNLQSLVDDQAMELGRELRPAEVSAILKQHGHPMLVASRYRDPSARALISPDLFPFYWFSMRAIFRGIWVTVRVIVTVFQCSREPPPPARFFCGLAATFCGRDSTLARASPRCSPRGNTWSRSSDIRQRWKPESLPPVPASGPAALNNRGPWCRLSVGVVWLIFLAMAFVPPRDCPGSGAEGAFSASSDAVYVDAAAHLALLAFWPEFLSSGLNLHALCHG